MNNKEEKIQYHITGRNKCESERISENQWDNICSTTLLTNNNGDDIGQFLYTPFGEFWVEEASEVDISHITRFFTNQQYDKESGLYYMNARYYDPHLGSFITPDPGKEDFNHYNYCRSNPIRYTDPTGLAIYEMINEVYFEFDLFNVVISTGSYHSFIFCIPDKPEDFADYFQQAKQEDRYRTYELDGKQIEGFVLRAGPENEKVDPNVNLDKDKPTQSPIIHEL